LVKPLEEYKGIHPPQGPFTCFEKGYLSQSDLEDYKGVYPLGSLWFGLQTLGSKRDYTPRFLVDQTHTSKAAFKVIILLKVLPREVKGFTPSWHLLVDLAILGNYKGVHPQGLSLVILFFDPITQ
jgi:hypothetical protein